MKHQNDRKFYDDCATRCFTIFTQFRFFFFRFYLSHSQLPAFSYMWTNMWTKIRKMGKAIKCKNCLVRWENVECLFILHISCSPFFSSFFFLVKITLNQIIHGNVGYTIFFFLFHIGFMYYCIYIFFFPPSYSTVYNMLVHEIL